MLQHLVRDIYYLAIVFQEQQCAVGCNIAVDVYAEDVARKYVLWLGKWTNLKFKNIHMDCSSSTYYCGRLIKSKHNL